jgi:hypothetical protein
MYRTNRQASAPLGMAFIFLSLVTLPVSMKAAGVNLGFGQKMASVVGAWEQVAGVFGAGYQPTASDVLAVVNFPACIDAPATVAEPSHGNCLLASACESEMNDDFAPLNDSSALSVGPQAEAQPVAASGDCPKAAARRAAAANRLTRETHAANVSTERISRRAIAVLAIDERESVRREMLVKKITEKIAQSRIELAEAMKYIPAASDIKIVLNMKPLPIPQCTVRLLPPKPAAESVQQLRRVARNEAQVAPAESAEL